MAALRVEKLASDARRAVGAAERAARRAAVVGRRAQALTRSVYAAIAAGRQDVATKLAAKAPALARQAVLLDAEHGRTWARARLAVTAAHNARLATAAHAVGDKAAATEALANTVLTAQVLKAITGLRVQIRMPKIGGLGGLGDWQADLNKSVTGAFAEAGKAIDDNAKTIGKTVGDVLNKAAPGVGTFVGHTTESFAKHFGEELEAGHPGNLASTLTFGLIPDTELDKEIKNKRAGAGGGGGGGGGGQPGGQSSETPDGKTPGGKTPSTPRSGSATILVGSTTAVAAGAGILLLGPIGAAAGIIGYIAGRALAGKKKS